MKILQVLLCCFSVFTLQSQNYFQQDVTYTIDVALNTKKKQLTAFESLVYKNNSPDTLYYMYMHVWPNAYKNQKTALFKQFKEHGQIEKYYTSPNTYGYIDSLDFKVNAEKVKWVFDSEHIDIVKIYFNNPLLPNQKIEITTPFIVQIPYDGISRMGYNDQGGFQITQWYPKPAVYDEKGWHPMPYLDLGEFYSEFGKFTVNITLPSSYVVGATGELQNFEEKQWLNGLVKGEENRNDSTLTKTITYVQDSIHDFAWFTNSNFKVSKSTFLLQGKQIDSWLYFTKYNQNDNIIQSSHKISEEAIKFYSKYNGSYPYSSVSVVQAGIEAGAGMEYPMITVVDDFDEETVFHEIGHNWFYGILGSNERDYPWLDEGLNTANQYRYFLFDQTKQGKLEKPGVSFELFESLGKSQAINLTSSQFSYINYGAIVYEKTALSFNVLRAYLGDDVYDEAMRFYFDNWKFKHPYPQHLKAAFEEVSHQDLSWFFNDFFNSTSAVNYNIHKKHSDSLNYTVYSVNNKSNIKFPLSIVTNTDTTWMLLDKKEKQEIYVENKIDSIKLGVTLFEFDYQKYHQEKTSEFSKLNIQFFNPYNNKNNELYVLPVIAGNAYDGVMLGATFNNINLFQKKFEFTVTPFYAFKSNQLNGVADVNYHLKQQKNSLFTFGLNFKRFSSNNITNYSDPNVSFDTYNQDYFKIKFSADYLKKSHKKFSNVTHQINFSTDYVEEYDEFKNSVDNAGNSFDGKTVSKNYFASLFYQYRFKDAVHDLRVKPSYNFGNVQNNSGNFNALTVDAFYRFKFNKNKRSIDVKFFAGKFLNNTTFNSRYAFQIAGKKGYQDYKYDYLLMGRNNTQGLFSYQQIQENGSFFNVNTSGSNGNWLLTSYVSIDFPIFLPVKFYMSNGVYPYQIMQNNEFVEKIGVRTEGGLGIFIIKDIFEIYFPVVFDAQTKQQLTNNQIKTSALLRFTFNLNEMNPVKLRGRIDEFVY